MFADFGRIRDLSCLKCSNILSIPMVPKIKICGISTPEVARHAINQGANAIGLMFYEKSKRNISIEQAIAINQVVTPFASQIGVVVNPRASFVQDILEQVHLDYIQFHGDESPEYCGSFDLPYIKVIRVQDSVDLAALSDRYSDAAALLLDTFTKENYGGTGDVFDWSKTNFQSDKPVILAGGLNPDNIGQAISIAQPYGVDVSTGVETDGVKDLDKITEFCKKVLNQN